MKFKKEFVATIRYRRKSVAEIHRDNYWELMHEVTRVVNERFSFQEMMKVNIVVKNRLETEGE